MSTCKNCLGDGIVGNGAEPWLKLGANSTCTYCGGTGQIQDESTPEVVETPPVVPESPVIEEVPVDNSSEPKGFVENIVDAILG